MPVLGYFGVVTPLLLFALFVAAALLDPTSAKSGHEQDRASSSAQRDVRPEVFDRLKALRIDK